MKKLITIIILSLTLVGCSNCKTRITPVDHAEKYMDINTDNYEKAKFKRPDGEVFEVIIYEKCK